MNHSLFGGHRYQVFLSSTFRDLIEERQQVIQTLQRINCFPVAMEHFPASYEEQWTYIKPLIEKSDYFICLIAGKYGHCGNDGVSFTQREFEYALECKIPILVFYHGEPESLPGTKIEETGEARAKLKAFLHLAKSDRLCEEWKRLEQLPSIVMGSVIQMVHDCPRPGWRSRADKSTEFLEIQLLNSQLENQVGDLEAKSRNAPIASFFHYDDAVSTIANAFSTTAKACNRSEEIMKVRLMGVCLHKSLPTLIHFIETTSLPIRIEVRLAILDKDCPLYSMLNHRWQALYDVFDDDLKDLLARLQSGALSRNISVKLVKYRHMPNWHGLLINYQHLFLGHCLWHEDGRLTAGQNPYDYYHQGTSTIHDRKIKQYVQWFDFCRRTSSMPKEEQLLVDTMLR